MKEEMKEQDGGIEIRHEGALTKILWDRVCGRNALQEIQREYS